ncbi:hypothetical protein BaRGS_00025587, partial [Batillaria attramentaria]
ARQTDREEIRRKLAMGTDEEYYAGERTFKKPSLSTRLQSGMNLQICFMNDAAAAATEETDINDLASLSTPKAHKTNAIAPQSYIKSPVRCLDGCGRRWIGGGSKGRPKSDPGLLANQFSLPPSDESIAERQQRLQQEAKVALAQASNMARMQLEVERQTKKKSPIADIVGVPELGDGRRVKISRKLLQEMNLAQLQVLVNDLHSQIESLNEELVHLLIERDDLHMEQDSMLVDIEDLTSFAQHTSETNNNKATLNNRNNAPPFSNKRLK